MNGWITLEKEMQQDVEGEDQLAKVIDENLTRAELAQAVDVLRPCPTPGLIQLLRSHRSTVAQLWTSAHYSGPGRAHTLLLSATLCITPVPDAHIPFC